MQVPVQLYIYPAAQWYRVGITQPRTTWNSTNLFLFVERLSVQLNLADFATTLETRWQDEHFILLPRTLQKVTKGLYTSTAAANENITAGNTVKTTRSNNGFHSNKHDARWMQGKFWTHSYPINLISPSSCRKPMISCSCLEENGIRVVQIPFLCSKKRNLGMPYESLAMKKRKRRP
jgi:hypothetical protein